jgi:hypothetical protein
MENYNKLEKSKAKVFVRRLLIYSASSLGILLLYALQHGLIWWWDKPELSGLPYRMAVAWLGCIMYRAMDDFVLINIPTYELMKSNAVGYAIYLFGYAFIIGSILKFV